MHTHTLLQYQNISFFLTDCALKTEKKDKTNESCDLTRSNCVNLHKIGIYGKEIGEKSELSHM